MSHLLIRKNRQVYFRIGYDESGLRQKVKNAGGCWRLEKRFWQLNYKDAVKLGLKDKIVELILMSTCGNFYTYMEIIGW